jgi:prepilin-type N-terminal cleavage/methylation domain-containing protein/prepilin-type processing-associated H-X9-DG protein
MRRKGFTLVELLVVIAAIVLAAILVSRLAERREPYGPFCGSNLSGIGNAMEIYSNDDENGWFPRAGGRNSVHGALADWQDPNEAVAFGYDTSSPGKGTITSSLWLLVKGDYATTKQFVCRTDPDTTGVFRPSNPWVVWDFGATPGKYCSYAYHFPYDDSGGLSYGLMSASNRALPVCADRNPEPQTSGNSRAHQGEGQNVLYVDGHVNFQRDRNCGANDDDIYTAEDGGSAPVRMFDSYLINEPF